MALVWVLAQGDDIIPIPSTKKRKYLKENVGTVDVVLTQQDLSSIENLVAKYPDAGQKYSDVALKLVNN